MDALKNIPFPFLVEHTIWLPGAIKDAAGIAGPLEDFCRDFDEHTLQLLEPEAPWLRDAFEEANGLSDEAEYDEEDMAGGIHKAVRLGKATGWLAQVRVPFKRSWGQAWLLWAYGATPEVAIATALAKGLELRRRVEEKEKV